MHTLRAFLSDCANKFSVAACFTGYTRRPPHPLGKIEQAQARVKAHFRAMQARQAGVLLSAEEEAKVMAAG
eukprot:CAMPEP_0168352836 /NCGR_PEP_ID=MMETSP0213-20121227/22834_1 /TAXON_ID=151035 /ORGANISM="Euplotes harpa, Strain FSP1.4" /LENGTH=70 /DNA_ID=CAMNT_0008364215 /DNA_START=1315 /DNA_END=1523 /DNA_ORIENTATION=+